MSGLKLKEMKPDHLKGGTIRVTFHDKPQPITTPKMKGGKQVYLDADGNETMEAETIVKHPKNKDQVLTRFPNPPATDPVLDKAGNPTFDYVTVRWDQPVANADGQVVANLSPGTESDLSDTTRAAIAGLIADREAVAKANKVKPWAD